MGFKYYALKIVLICVIVFFLQMFVPGFTEFFLLNKSSWFEPWRFITSIFLHGGFGHLLYNMFALALFGSLLEKSVGGKRFLIIYLVSGIISNLISINFYDSSLGASGAIYGVFGVLMVIKPGMMVWAVGFPMPMFIAGLVWATGDLIGLFTPSNVGHIAHLSGMGVGLIWGVVLRTRHSFRNSENNEFVLDEQEVRKWEDHYLR